MNLRDAMKHLALTEHDLEPTRLERRLDAALESADLDESLVLYEAYHLVLGTLEHQERAVPEEEWFDFEFEAEPFADNFLKDSALKDAALKKVTIGDLYQELSGVLDATTAPPKVALVEAPKPPAPLEINLQTPKSEGLEDAFDLDFSAFEDDAPEHPSTKAKEDVLHAAVASQPETSPSPWLRRGLMGVLLLGVLGGSAWTATHSVEAQRLAQNVGTEFSARVVGVDAPVVGANLEEARIEFNRRLFETWLRGGVRLRYETWQRVPVDLRVLDLGRFESAVRFVPQASIRR